MYKVGDAEIRTTWSDYVLDWSAPFSVGEIAIAGSASAATLETCGLLFVTLDMSNPVLQSELNSECRLTQWKAKQESEQSTRQY